MVPMSLAGKVLGHAVPGQEFLLRKLQEAMVPNVVRPVVVAHMVRVPVYWLVSQAVLAAEGRRLLAENPPDVTIVRVEHSETVEAPEPLAGELPVQDSDLLQALRHRPAKERSALTVRCDLPGCLSRASLPVRCSP